MPKRKSHKKKSGSKKGRGRGRVGALNFKKPQDMDLLMLAGGTIAGAVVKRLADNLIAKQAQTTGVTIKQGTVDLLEIVGGGVVFYFFDQPFVRGLGLGLVGSTIYNKTANMRLAGLGQSTYTNLVPFQPRPNVNGVTATPSVAGIGNMNAYSFPSPSNVGRVRAYASHMR
jgi:hypothetical protein